MNEKQYSKENHLEWIEAYNSGLSQAEICRKFNVDDSTLSRIFDELNIIRRKVISSKEGDPRWIEEYQKGKSLNQIAKQFNSNKSTIYRYLTNQGIIRSLWYLLASRIYGVFTLWLLAFGKPQHS